MYTTASFTPITQTSIHFVSVPTISRQTLSQQEATTVHTIQSTMEYPPHAAHPQPIQFYQYRPDSESRHSATFTPLPQEQPIYPGQMMAFPPAHYTAPQYWQQPPMPHGHFIPQEVMTPNRSPTLTLSMPAPKLTMDHMRYLNSPTPPTPCLSVCPSTASSPPASTIYPTPTQAHGYFTLPARRFKEDLPVQSFDFEHNWEESTRE